MRSGFYSLGRTWSAKWFLGQLLQKDIEAVDNALYNGMRGFKGIVHIKIITGTKPGDFLCVGFPIHIVSSKVLDIWKEFEKFEIYPVVIQNTISPVEYTGVTFLGRGGPFDPEKSKAVYFKSKDSNGKGAIMNMDGLYFDDSQWDGSDLLTVDDFPCLPIVTERVVKAMKKAKVTNCKYTPLEQYCYYKKKFSKSII